MIDVQLHYRSEQTEQRRLPAVPAVGSYIFGGDGRLWRVEAVLFSGKAVHAYTVQVSDRMTGDLISQWATWGEAADSPEATAPRPSRKAPRPRQCDQCGESTTIRPCPVCAALAAKQAKSRRA